MMGKCLVFNVFLLPQASTLASSSSSHEFWVSFGVCLFARGYVMHMGTEFLSFNLRFMRSIAERIFAEDREAST